MHKKKAALLLLTTVLLIFTPVLAQESGTEKCKNVKYRSLCYTLAAQAEKNGDLCEGIADEYESQQCREIVNQSNNDFFDLVFPSALLGAALLFAVSFYILRKKFSSKARIGRIADYIAKWKSNGYDEPAITSTLAGRGFSKGEIDKAYGRIGGMEKR